MSSKKINFIDFFLTVGLSKRLLRAGWVREHIQDPESVAEHSFRVAMLAMVLSDKLGYKVDKEKLIKMALLHDLGEVITGDIIIERRELVDIKKRDEKERSERVGIRQIFDKIGEGESYAAIFDEMINRNTLEAKIFWQFDKLEMVIQAFEYEKEQGKDLEEFFIGFEKNYTQDPFVRNIFNDLKKRRKKIHESR